MSNLASFYSLRRVHVHKRPDLRRRERDVVVAQDNLELLTSDPVWRRPRRVVLLHDLTVVDNAPELLQNRHVDVALKKKPARKGVDEADVSLLN